MGCSIASLRVDGNDFLAVLAASPSRQAGALHLKAGAGRMGDVSRAVRTSTSDPTRYRPADDWPYPLGACARLARHLDARRLV